jgi:FtsZ-binding cell division protein ZapB
MAPSSRADVAGLAHQLWRQLCVLAERNSGEFAPENRDDAAGWRWEGAAAALMRRAAPEVPDADRRRAQEYLQATTMLVNVSGGPRPVWFIRKDWHGGPPAHVHLVPRERPRRPEREPGQPPPAVAVAQGGFHGDLAEAVKQLVSHTGVVEAEAESLRAENDRLRIEVEELRADRDRLMAENIRMRDVARQVTELLGGIQQGQAGRLRAEASGWRPDPAGTSGARGLQQRRSSLRLFRE